MSKLKLNMVTIMVSKIITISLSMLAGILIARGFGIESYGKYAVATIFLFFFYMVFDCGFDLSFISLSSKKREKTEIYFSNSIILKVFVIAVSFLFIAAIVRLTNYPEDVQHLILLLFVPIILPVLNATHLTYLQIQGKFLSMSLMNVYRALLFLITTLAVLKLGGTLFELAIAQSISTIVVTGTFFIITRKCQFTFSLAIIRELMKEQVPFAVSSFLTNLYLRAPLLYMTKAVVPVQIALFDSSNKITNSMQQGISSIDSSLIPSLFAAVKKRDVNNLNMLIHEIFSFITAIALYSSSTIYIFSDDIIQFLYGSSFAPAAIILRILSINLLIVSFAPLFGTLIVAKGLIKQKTVVQVISLLITVVSSLILIPRFGVAGVAVTLTISTVFLFVSYLIYAHMTIDFLLFPLVVSFFRFSILLSITVACYYQLKTFTHAHFLISMLIGSVVYLIGSLWLLSKKNTQSFPLKAVANE